MGPFLFCPVSFNFIVRHSDRTFKQKHRMKSTIRVDLGDDKQPILKIKSYGDSKSDLSSPNQQVDLTDKMLSMMLEDTVLFEVRIRGGGASENGPSYTDIELIPIKLQQIKINCDPGIPIVSSIETLDVNGYVTHYDDANQFIYTLATQERF